MTSRASTTESTTVGTRMAPTKRRGPRYRAPRRAPSGEVREPLTEQLARELGISDNAAHDLRFRTPHLLAKAMDIMRRAGRTDAIAAMIAPIDRMACTVVAPDPETGIQHAVDLEGMTNAAETAYLLDRTPANRAEFLRCSAQEILAEAARDARIALEGR